MNLYNNGTSSFGFSGWRADPPETFNSSDWRHISSPQASDYVRSPSSAPQASDYVRSPAESEAPITESPPPTMPTAEISAADNKHYSIQELQEIGSKPKEEVINFFKNIGGTVEKVTEEGRTVERYESSVLPGRVFTVTDNSLFWVTNYHTPATNTFENNAASVDSSHAVASDNVKLSDDEITAIINSQNNSAPQAQDYTATQPPQAPSSASSPINTASNHNPKQPQNDIASSKQPNTSSLNENTNSIPEPLANVQSQQPDNTNTATNTTPPLNQSISTLGNAATIANAAAKNPHQTFLAEAEKLKNSASLKHDLASGFSHSIMEFEQGNILDERKAYYANNREALNQAIDKIRADAAELTQKHGDTAGKIYFLNGISKITGAIGNLADAYELGDRIKNAFDNDNWSPVVGQVSKIVATSATASTGAVIARSAGLLLAGSGLGTIAMGVAAGAVVAFAISNSIDYLEKYVSNSDQWNFKNAENKYTDLVLIGNHSSQEHIKLKAENVTLIGKNHFKNLEIESETVTIIGNTDENLMIKSPKIEVIPGKEISDKFMQQPLLINEDSKTEETSAESPIQEPPYDENPIQSQSDKTIILDSDPYINQAYLEAAAAKAQKSPQEYLTFLTQVPEMEDIPDPSLIDSIIEYQTMELEKIFNKPAEESMPAVPKEKTAYPDISLPPSIDHPPETYL